MTIKDLEENIEKNIKNLGLLEDEIARETTRFKSYGEPKRDREFTVFNFEEPAPIHNPTLGQRIFCHTKVKDKKEESYYENPYKRFTVGIVTATALTLGINPEIPPYLTIGSIGLIGIVPIIPATLTGIVDTIYEPFRCREFNRVIGEYKNKRQELKLERKELRYQLYREENPNDDLVIVGDILKTPVEKTCCKRGHARSLFNEAHERIMIADLNPIKRDQMIIELYHRFYQPMHNSCSGDTGFTTSNKRIVEKVLDAYFGLQYHGQAPDIRRLGIHTTEIPEKYKDYKELK